MRGRSLKTPYHRYRHRDPCGRGSGGIRGVGGVAEPRRRLVGTGLGLRGTTAMTVHVLIGAAVAILAAIELWIMSRNPPRLTTGS